ncbi:MAG: DUF871 domain-containing protein [Lachnospiraceae bacterium]|nr:DUF871 domain-containing protein [Lachnospiraceae bacterium]
MAKLGLSIYPEHSELEKDLEYLSLAGKYGFQRVFTCLISMGDEKKEELIEKFRVRIDEAHKNGMEVILDVNPTVFHRLGMSSTDLSVFSQMHADGIRLDEGFTGMGASRLTFNPWGLKVEMNASTEMGFIEDVVSHYPNREKLMTCHNFYPQKYTGVSLEHFNYCNVFIKERGLNVAAFVSSQNKEAIGPWPLSEGLCTLEMHRETPVDFQVRHMFATGMVDDVLIANAYATKEELEACGAANPFVLTFGICLEKELTPAEKAVLHFNQGHVVRGDMSEYMLRSTMTRVVYASEDIPAANTRDLKRGDVVIINNNYGRYKGELHIVLRDMPNDGRKNVIGHLPEHEQILLDYAKPWKHFCFL